MNPVLLSSIRGFIADNFLFRSADEAPGDDESLLDSGIVDSTGILELIEFIEASYRIRVAAEEMVPANFESIDAISTFLGRRVGG